LIDTFKKIDEKKLKVPILNLGKIHQEIKFYPAEKEERVPVQTLELVEENQNNTGITVTDDFIIGFGSDKNAQSPPPFDGQVLAKGEDITKNDHPETLDQTEENLGIIK